MILNVLIFALMFSIKYLAGTIPDYRSFPSPTRTVSCSSSLGTGIILHSQQFTIPWFNKFTVTRRTGQRRKEILRINPLQEFPGGNRGDSLAFT